MRFVRTLGPDAFLKRWSLILPSVSTIGVGLYHCIRSTYDDLGGCTATIMPAKLDLEL